MGSKIQAVTGAISHFELDEKAALTYSLEKRRAVMLGILETASTTFLLLIAVRHFNASPNAKWAVVSGNSWGLLLGPAVVFACARTGLRVGTAAALLCLTGSLFFLIGSVSSGLPMFALSSVVAMALTNAVIPLSTQLYQDNYPAILRGRLFSRTTVLRIAAGALFAAAAGYSLSGKIQWYPAILLIFAVALFYSAYCFRRCPSQTINYQADRSLFEGFKYLRSDALFKNTLICWMLMGFGNLMMLPMRVEYLANPRYGLALEEWKVAFLVAVLPNIARIFVSPLWGAVFDRINFFHLRIAVNMGFALGILSFFQVTTPTGLVFGAIMFGIANAGGEIAWSLWVTKFAPSERVADYMSVHTFLTGCRGLAAPWVAFHALEFMPLNQLGLISAAMVIGANFWILPLSKSDRGKPMPQT